MESLQNIKRRIKGIKNINQITKAMELVAATKMRRSQEVALASRGYAFSALEMLANLSRVEAIESPLLTPREKVSKRAVVLVMSDKGLAGSFNSSVIREFEKWSRKEGLDFKDPSLNFIAVGARASGYLERRTDRLLKSFTRVGDQTTLEEVMPLADYLVQGYLSGSWDEVTVFSTNFRSALQQEVFRRNILPVNVESIKRSAEDIIPETGRWANIRSTFGESRENMLDYLIEPSPALVAAELARHLVYMQIYHLVLEANASEHAARRVAMKNASDNAEGLAGELTVVYNTSRQAAITKEIIEIVGGAEAMN